MRNKPYYQFIINSDEIPPLYNKQSLVKTEKKNITVIEDFNANIHNKINAFYSDKKNIKLISSIFCYFLMTIDKKHNHFIMNLEKYLDKHKNITIPSSSEIPIIIDNVVDTGLKQIKESMINFDDLQNEIQQAIHILLTDCIFHTQDLHIHKTSFKKQYPNILRITRDTFVPILVKHNILEKIIIIVNETCGNIITSYLPYIENEKSKSYFSKLRDMIYNDEECKKAFGYNIYIFLSKKTNKISYIRYLNNVLKHKQEIHNILECISNNPNFVKRLLKQALCKIAPMDNYDKNIDPSSTMQNFINISKTQTKQIARKCRTIVNNIFVISKMGKSVYTVGKKIENKFPGIAKSLFF